MAYFNAVFSQWIIQPYSKSWFIPKLTAANQWFNQRLEQVKWKLRGDLLNMTHLITWLLNANCLRNWLIEIGFNHDLFLISCCNRSRNWLVRFRDWFDCLNNQTHCLKTN
jgi:hypothetical protein